jgi:hypothetical protein
LAEGEELCLLDSSQKREPWLTFLSGNTVVGYIAETSFGVEVAVLFWLERAADKFWVPVLISGEREALGALLPFLGAI